MNKQELVRSMIQASGGSRFITKAELVRFMGLSNQRYVARYVDGLDRVDGKRFFIPDVAERIIGRVER